MRTFTSQMELSVVLWAFADLKFCFPWWKKQGKKRIGSLPTEAALMFVSNNGRCLGIISMAMSVQIIFQLYQVKEKKSVHIHVHIYTLQKYNINITACKIAKQLILETKMSFKGKTRSLHHFRPREFHNVSHSTDKHHHWKDVFSARINKTCPQYQFSLFLCLHYAPLAFTIWLLIKSILTLKNYPSFPILPLSINF